MAILEAVFADKPGQTPQEVERRRRMAQELLKKGTEAQAPRSPLELAGRLAMTLTGQYQAGKAEREDASNRTAASKALIDAVYGGSSAPSFASQARDTFTTNDPGAGATVSGPSKPINMSGNEVYSGFMDTVKAGGLTNPYGLAAVAATAKAESGFSPGNVNRTWSDPSESGQPGTAGGIMSWRGPRYQALAAKGDLSPAGQAKFFLQEDPNLIAALNNAKSVEEAQQLMNRAWQFAGWNRPGGEAANRLGYANSFLPAFQGQPQQVASLDPSVGMPPRTASEAVTAMGAGGSAPGSLSDEVAAYQQTPEYAARFPGRAVAPSFPGKQADDMAVAALPQPRNVGALPVPPNAQPMPQGIPAEFAGSQQLANAQGGIVPALMGGTAASPEQIAQARALGAAQPQPQPQGQDNRALIATLLGNPYTAEAGQQLLMQEMQRRQEANDPLTQLKIQQAQREAAGQWQKLSDNRLFNPVTGETRDIPAAAGAAPTDLGLNPQYGVDKDGNPVLIQIGKDGKAVQTSLPEGVKLSKEPIKLDAGTHFVLLDPITRQPVGQIPKDNRQEAFDKGIGGAEGKAVGEANVQLPQTIASAQKALADIDAVINDPNLKYAVGVGGLLPAIPGTSQAGTVARIEQLQGQAFLQAFESLKGGGQITEVEGKKATDAIARLNRSQTVEDFTAALKDLRTVVNSGLERAKSRGSSTSPTSNSDTVPAGVDAEDWKWMTPEERKLFQ